MPNHVQTLNYINNRQILCQLSVFIMPFYKELKYYRITVINDTGGKIKHS